MANENIIEDILSAALSWSTRIIDAELKLTKTKDIRQHISDSIQRLILDGFISEQDSIELEYVADLWIDLYKSFLRRHNGANLADKEILKNVIELLTLKQISKEFCINIILQLL